MASRLLRQVFFMAHHVNLLPSSFPPETLGLSPKGCVSFPQNLSRRVRKLWVQLMLPL